MGIRPAQARLVRLLQMTATLPLKDGLIYFRMRSVRRTISLFTGVGGLDLGLEAAGFGVAVAVEIDRDAVNAVRKNRDWHLMEEAGRPCPIDRIDSRALLRAGRHSRNRGRLL